MIRIKLKLFKSRVDWECSHSVSQMRRAIGAKLPPIPRAPPLQIWKEEWDCKIAVGRIGRSCCRRVLLIVDHQIAEVRLLN